MFNCYFYKLRQTNYSNELYLFINVNYKKYRTLQNKESDEEEIKSKCNLVPNDIDCRGFYCAAWHR